MDSRRKRSQRIMADATSVAEKMANTDPQSFSWLHDLIKFDDSKVIDAVRFIAHRQFGFDLDILDKAMRDDTLMILLSQLLVRCVVENKPWTKECGVCMDVMHLDTAAMTSCGHLFHKNCIDTALEHAANKCPACRQRTGPPVGAGFVALQFGVPAQGQTSASWQRLQSRMKEWRRERNERKAALRRLFRELLRRYRFRNRPLLTIAGGVSHTVVLVFDGSGQHTEVHAWGDNRSGECDVPAAIKGQVHRVVQVAAAGWRTILVLDDGVGQNSEVFAWGRSTSGECNVPAAMQRQVHRVRQVVQVAAALWHTVALSKDGAGQNTQVHAWGHNNHGQCDVPAALQGKEVVQVAAGGFHTVALVADGAGQHTEMHAWGNNNHGQCDVPTAVQGQVHRVAQVAAGELHTVVLMEDGAVHASGYNFYGQCDVPAAIQGKVMQVAAGSRHTVAVVEDGVHVWGNNDFGQCDVPATVKGKVVQLAVGNYHTVVVLEDGPNARVQAWGRNDHGQCDVPAAFHGNESQVAAV